VNIGWDMVDIPPNKDGTFEFVSRWLRAVASFPQGHTHICFANAAFRRAADHPALNAIDWRIAGDWTGAYQLRREGYYLRHQRSIRRQIDVLVSVYRPPLVWRGKSIAIVLDCTTELFPSASSPKGRVVAAIRSLGARRADGWLAISEWTRRDAIRLRGYAPERTRSAGIPLADIDVPMLPSASRPSGLPNLGETRKYAFYCSSLANRKNHVRLIRAWRRAFPDREVLLVLAGRLLPGVQPEIPETIRQAESEGWVKWLGLVEDDERERLYAGSDFVVYPSLYEGFGMPVLEALRYFKPVLTSEGTSTEEVGGKAVLLCNPNDEDSLVRSLKRIAGDEALRAQLKAEIPAVLERYSLSNVARELNDGIEYLAGLT
jgi:glycosyltransferase involved in cell wall biosynthesis